jgi:hypothetical protein
MIIPTNDECRRILSILSDEPKLTEWEAEFVESNMDRTEFTDKQRQVIGKFKEKYDCD